MALDDLDYEDLSPNQRQKIQQGCLYELAKLVSNILLTFIFLYALPLTGPAEKWIELIFITVGAFAIARLIIKKWVYPGNPFTELYTELYLESLKKTKRNEEGS